jgi:hypothetical protein
MQPTKKGILHASTIQTQIILSFFLTPNTFHFTSLLVLCFLIDVPAWPPIKQRKRWAGDCEKFGRGILAINTPG